MLHAVRLQVLDLVEEVFLPETVPARSHRDMCFTIGPPTDEARHRRCLRRPRGAEPRDDLKASLFVHRTHSVTTALLPV